MNTHTGKKETQSDDKPSRLVVYEQDAPAQLHESIERYQGKVRSQGRKITKSAATAELIQIGLKHAIQPTA